MKKILISAYTCCPNRGSEPGNGWGWIVNYDKNNFTQVVLTSGMFTTEIKKYLSENKCNISFLFLDSTFGLKILKIPLFGAYLHYYLWLYNSRKYIKKINAEEWKTFDFAQHVTYGSIRLGTPLYKIPVPIIIGPVGGGTPVHPSLRKYFGSHYFTEWIKEKFSVFLSIINPSVKKSINHANHIYFSNSYVEKFILKYKPRSSSKVYDSGLSEYFKMEMPVRTLDQEEINIIWTGRMLPRKGLNLAIESFYRLKEAYHGEKKIHLLIAGDGAMKKNAALLTKKFNLQNDITFLGNVSHKVLVDYYKKSQLFLFPSLKDSGPMQIFEAMAMGLPVITLDHQGMAEQVIPNTGIKVRVGNDVDYPVELSKAMLQLISDENVYDLYSRKAYIHGQNQVWSKRIKEFINSDLEKLLS